MKEIIVLGGLGASARRDRCVDRILYGGGCEFTLSAHISTDKPMVVRKYETDHHNWSNRQDRPGESG